MSATNNKQGQALGPKGRATRNRLLAAANKLMKKLSPLEITAVGIAEEAGTSSATFYMYFTDVRDVLYELAVQAGIDGAKAFESLTDLKPSDDVEVLAKALIVSFNKVWNNHRNTLRYRNLEADRGDARFEKLRMAGYTKELKIMTEWMRSWDTTSENKMTKSDAWSLASVLHASLERLASIDPKVINKSLGTSRIIAAQARIIAQVIVDSQTWGKLPIE
ncbi:MAG: TetR/AcrR family transcriptional regulator [Spongiibacteraceae bacterium]